MKTVDKISKETLGLVEYSKDLTKSNLVNFNSNGEIKTPLSEEQLQSVYSLIDASISQAFQRSLPSFQKNVESILSSNEKKEEEAGGNSFFRRKK